MVKLEVGKAEERFCIKKMALGSFIKAVGIERLLLSLRTYLFLRNLSPQDGWVTHARIDENPAIRGHDLCFDRTCQQKPHAPKRGTTGRETVRNNDRASMTSRY